MITDNFNVRLFEYHNILWANNSALIISIHQRDCALILKNLIGLFRLFEFDHQMKSNYDV